MRNNNNNNEGFMSGLLTGVALGAMVVMAMSPQVRRPMVNGASQLGNRMQKMWRRNDRAMDQMVPGDLT